MKTKTIKLVMAALVVLFSLNANAYDAYIDGIYYNLNTDAKTAEVTSGNNKYTGEIVIPAFVEKDGVTYSVTSIGDNAFYRCGLTSVVIPNSVTSIESSAFSCKGLTSIKVGWNRPLAISNDVFYAVNKTECTLYVPKGTATMFMSAPIWSEFVNIVEYEDGEDAHYITIRMGDGGVLKQSVELGKTYTYAVSADEGWEVNTLTFDGEDMTALLMEGQFSTPVLIRDAELNVVFKQKGNDIKGRSADSQVKVYASGKSIIVKGADENAPVNVYGTNGVLIKSAVGNTTLSLEQGVYIVKVGKESFKVGL